MLRISKTPVPVRLCQNLSACEAFSKPLCLSDFFKTPPKHVCMDAKHVCMFAERVCMFGENRAPEDEVRFLTKTFSI